MSPNHTTSQVLPDGTLLDGMYEIEGLLGSGGFGKTYCVFDRQLGRRLAVKEFFPTETAMRTGLEVRPIAETKRATFEKGLESFSQEARHLASFAHPNIVKVFRSFDSNGTSYIVLEYVEGIDLEDWLNDLGVAPTQAELDRLIIALLSALELIHGAQILHRDIAPKNIRIRDRDRAPVLLDFGLAKSILPQASAQSSAVIVAHGYAPTKSYATGTKLQGPWTDIYGLAAVLYRALTGVPPPTAPERLFDDQMLPAVSLPNSSSYRKSVLDGIDWGLSINPADRPQNVADWRATLIDGRVRTRSTEKLSPAPVSAATTILPVQDLGGVNSDAVRARRRLSYGLIGTVLFIVGGVTMGAVFGPKYFGEFIGLAPNGPKSGGGQGSSGAGPIEEAAKAEELRLQMERERANAAREQGRAEADRKAAEEAKRIEEQKQAALEEERRKDAEREQKERVKPQQVPEEKPEEEKQKAKENQKSAAPEEAPKKQQEEPKRKAKWKYQRNAARDTGKEEAKKKRARAPEPRVRSAERPTQHWRRSFPSARGGGYSGGGAGGGTITLGTGN